jgi:hypothetical protein
LEVWQNCASFGGTPIGGAVEALFTKVVNQGLSVSLIVVFFVAAALLAYHNQTATLSVMR